MKKRTPSVALIWFYQGKDTAARRAEIEKFEYPDLTVVCTTSDVPAGTDVCVFWVDDDKPVTKNFIREMTHPLISGPDCHAVMHFWAGNAISVSKKELDAAGVDTNVCGDQSLLKVLLPILDISDERPMGRLHLAFSSTERLAPLSMEAVGFPS